MQPGEVIGHQALWEALRRTADAGRIPHAQLFSGAPGRGTLPLALAYATYLQCGNRHDGKPCGACPQCLQIAEAAHPDLHFVFPVNRQGKKSAEVMLSDGFLPSWRKIIRSTGGYFDEAMWNAELDLGRNLRGAISVHEAASILHKLSYKSFEAPYKILLIWQPEAMSEQAANKLLKILEEPWERTLFMLVSSAPEKLLGTIRSRVQEIPVPPIEAEALAADLGARHALSDEVARAAARLSGGDRIEADRILNDRDNETEVFALFSSLMRLGYNRRYIDLAEWAEHFASTTREQQRAFLTYAARMVRESYMEHAGLSGQIGYLWGEEAQFARRFAPFVHRNIAPLMAEIERAAAEVARNGHPTIVFTHFALTVSKYITA